MFTVALLTTAKTWKQPKCSQVDQYIKMLCVCICVCVCVCVCWDEGRYQGGKSHGLDNDSNQTRSRFL